MKLLLWTVCLPNPTRLSLWNIQMLASMLVHLILLQNAWISALLQLPTLYTTCGPKGFAPRTKCWQRRKSFVRFICCRLGICTNIIIRLLLTLIIFCSKQLVNYSITGPTVTVMIHVGLYNRNRKRSHFSAKSVPDMLRLSSYWADHTIASAFHWGYWILFHPGGCI